MGKSPGKWIKSILFGKKKGKELSRSVSEKPVRVSAKEHIPPLTLDAPLNSEQVSVTVVDRIEKKGSEKAECGELPNDGIDSYCTKEGGDNPTISESGLQNGSEKMNLEQPTTVVNQAQDSFKNLKDIIKLQSLVRGHLVRRQAVATLFCVQGIVKFQAIARGHMVRLSNSGNAPSRKLSLVAEDAKHEDSCETGKRSVADSLSSSAFISELLLSSPTAMPLRLQYGPENPNSAWDWLNRWSTSRVWASDLKLKKTCDLEHQAVETEQTKLKHKAQRKQSANVGNGPTHAKNETDKLKHNSKKLSGQLVKAQNHPHAGTDKIKQASKKNAQPQAEIPNDSKQASKKISQPPAEIPNDSGADVEKPKEYPKKSSKSETPKFSNQTSNAPSHKPSEDSEAAVSKHVDDEPTLGFVGPNRLSNGLGINSEEKDFKDDDISSENCQLGRTTSFPSKRDDQEASPDTVKKVPSYMATTASSKAKVKAQASPRFGLDFADRNDLTRRHSLPSSVGGKMISSPRVHRLVQANGGGHKIDRSLSSSRDVTDKVIQPDWKR